MNEIDKSKIWKKVTYPNIRKDMYLISEDGDLWNIVYNRCLKPIYSGEGYIIYNMLCEDGKHRGVRAHRLVAYQFVPNPNNEIYVDHIDGIRNHNHYTNLEWVSPKENSIRGKKMSLVNGTSIYTEEMTRYICQKFENGESLKSILKDITGDPDANSVKYPNLYAHIRRLNNKTVWPTITSQYNYISEELDHKRISLPKPQTSNFVYSERIIHDVCRRLEAGETCTSITKSYNDNKLDDKFYAFVRGIRNGKQWVNISSQYDFSNAVDEHEYGWDEEIANLVDAGYNKAEIYKALNIDKNNETEKHRIKKMIRRYKAFKKIQNNEDIIVK